MFLSAAVAFAAGFKLFTATTDVFAGAFCIGQRRRLLHRSRLDSSRPGITLKIGGSHQGGSNGVKKCDVEDPNVGESIIGFKMNINNMQCYHIE